MTITSPGTESVVHPSLIDTEQRVFWTDQPGLAQGR